MVATKGGETNGVKKYLVGVAVWLTSAIAAQFFILHTTITEVKTDVKWIQRDVQHNTHRIEKLEQPMASILPRDTPRT